MLGKVLILLVKNSISWNLIKPNNWFDCDEA